MLDSLRNFASTWPGKILGAFLLVGLAGFGITGVITSIGSNTIARVGDRDISTLDFQRAYQAQINAAADQLGTIPTPEQALSLGIPGAVLNRLATNEALNMLAEDFGLGVSNERLAENLRRDPAFAGTLGTFDRAVFERTLRLNGITENDFFEDQRETAMRQQLALAMFSRAHAPKAIQTLVQRYGEDRRTLEFVVIDVLSLLPVGDPGDEVLQAYLEENQQNYTTDEMRSIRLIQLSPEILARDVEISDAQVEAEYERNKQNFFKIERRNISQVLLADEELVSRFEEGLAAGKDFETLVGEMGLTPSNLGMLSLGEITDVLLADAAFDLEAGETTIIPGIQGRRAVTVSQIEEGGQIPLEEAREQIVEKLKLAAGRAAFIDVLDQIDEQRAAFIDIAQTASEFDLNLTETAIGATGEQLVQDTGLMAAEAAQVANAVFAAQIGKLAPSVSLGANKNVWFDLTEITEARNQTLEEVRNEVLQAWIAEQRNIALEEKANAFVTQLQDGQSLVDLAVINGLFPETSQAVSRSGDGTSIIDVNVANVAYRGGVGHVGAAQNGEGNYVVFEVTEIIPATGELRPQDAEFIAGGYRDNLYSDFANALRADTNLSINQGLLNQVLGLGIQ